MAFRIRRKRKGSPKAKQEKKVVQKADQEKLQELAEWDVIADSSRKPQRSESSLDSFDDEGQG